LWGPNARTVRGSHVRNVLSGTDVLDASKEAFDRKEIDAAIAACFQRVDADDSTTLDREELTTILRRRWNAAPRRRRGRDPSSDHASRALSQLDVDGNGAVTSGEWKTGIRALLRYWDRDMDGRWSRKELNIAAK
ncbi:MAG: hypothetical protein V3U11_09235, partial [Planctomycetota bacterium]